MPKETTKRWKSESMMRPIIDADIEYIKQNISNNSIKKIAKELRRSSITISTWLHDNGFSNLIAQKSKQSQIQKGNIPPNKGKKWDEYLTPEKQDRCRATQFKKGNIPHNTKPQGEDFLIRHVDGIPYVYNRIALGKWRIYSHIVWEQHHGKVPPKHIITYIDGDTTNVDISNLKLISMAENMLRNTIHNYPPELVTAIKTNSQLKKIIKQW